MQTKECIVCGEEFYYQNSSKKTCSDKCRQQLSRDRKREEFQEEISGYIEERKDNYKFEFDNLVDELYRLTIDRCFTLCKEQSVHISEIIFLFDISHALDFFSERADESLEFHELMEKMIRTASENEDKDGYISFKTKHVKDMIKTLKRLRKNKF